MSEMKRISDEEIENLTIDGLNKHGPPSDYSRFIIKPIEFVLAHTLLDAQLEADKKVMEETIKEIFTSFEIGLLPPAYTPAAYTPEVYKVYMDTFAAIKTKYLRQGQKYMPVLSSQKEPASPRAIRLAKELGIPRAHEDTLVGVLEDCFEYIRNIKQVEQK